MRARYFGEVLRASGKTGHLDPIPQPQRRLALAGGYADAAHSFLQIEKLSGLAEGNRAHNPPPVPHRTIRRKRQQPRQRHRRHRERVRRRGPFQRDVRQLGHEVLKNLGLAG